MTENQAWQIFKKTGSVEAYLTYSQMKNNSEIIVNAIDDKNKGNNPENEGHSG